MLTVAVRGDNGRRSSDLRKHVLWRFYKILVDTGLLPKGEQARVRKRLSIYLSCNGGLRPPVAGRVFDDCPARTDLFALADAPK